MSSKKRRINQLEDRNSELAKEILLNEAAIYQSEKEIDNIDADIIDHEHIQKYISQIRVLVERLTNKNEIYKKEIFENELLIKKLKEDE